MATEAFTRLKALSWQEAKFLAFMAHVHELDKITYAFEFRTAEALHVFYLTENSLDEVTSYEGDQLSVSLDAISFKDINKINITFSAFNIDPDDDVEFSRLPFVATISTAAREFTLDFSDERNRYKLKDVRELLFKLKTLI
ncbi:hypothetical protein I8J29_05295 [Paenibacillus sp. MWE-103]|uniref:Immunity protein 50 of polymorphic toxin system n=1 Tax=Paenibacillus artemisiicola TaxID=1172618 RepID=A0ABS3W5M8_9BACL|nr:hypothetical protein [Paenibacillus artemisiicola]MBO7743600.1 hypothetical protein [Paenibacillus artemisiicola]